MGVRTAKEGRSVASGSAVVELCCIMPFVLILLATVWDVRESVSHRTQLTRDMYVVAELIADHSESPSPIANVLSKLSTRLQTESVGGSLTAAVVVRGTERPDSTTCPADEWCQPEVAVRTHVSWAPEDTACAAAPDDALPSAGDHFDADATVLPNEDAIAATDTTDTDTDTDTDSDDDADDDPAHAAWLSRNMTDDEWWVVVDACFEPSPGLFFGRLPQMAAQLFDTSFTVRKRAAWGSVHDLDDCGWC